MKRNYSDGKWQTKPGLEELISFSELHWSYLQSHYMHLCFRILESPSHRERSKIQSSLDVKYTEFWFTWGFFINKSFYWTLAVLPCRISKAITVPSSNKPSEATPSMGKWRPEVFRELRKICYMKSQENCNFSGSWWATKFVLCLL